MKEWIQSLVRELGYECNIIPRYAGWKNVLSIDNRCFIDVDFKHRQCHFYSTGWGAFGAPHYETTCTVSFGDDTTIDRLRRCIVFTCECSTRHKDIVNDFNFM